jgi:hypothetical protein
VSYLIWFRFGLECVSRRAGHGKNRPLGGHIIVSRKKIVTGRESYEKEMVRKRKRLV